MESTQHNCWRHPSFQRIHWCLIILSLLGFPRQILSHNKKLKHLKASYLLQAEKINYMSPSCETKAKPAVWDRQEGRSMRALFMWCHIGGEEARESVWVCVFVRGNGGKMTSGWGWEGGDVCTEGTSESIYLDRCHSTHTDNGLATTMASLWCLSKFPLDSVCVCVCACVCFTKPIRNWSPETNNIS